MREIEKIINKAQNFVRLGSYYSAALEYAALFHFYTDENKPSLNPRNIFSSNEIDIIYKDLLREYERAERVMSFGKKWNDDEFLFVFTFLTSYTLLKDYFIYYSLPWSLEVVRIYNLIEISLFDTKNKKQALFAEKTIRKNRKDLSQKWLDEIFKITT